MLVAHSRNELILKEKVEYYEKLLDRLRHHLAQQADANAAAMKMVDEALAMRMTRVVEFVKCMEG